MCQNWSSPRSSAEQPPGAERFHHPATPDTAGNQSQARRASHRPSPSSNAPYYPARQHSHHHTPAQEYEANTNGRGRHGQQEMREKVFSIYVCRNHDEVFCHICGSVYIICHVLHPPPWPYAARILIVPEHFFVVRLLKNRSWSLLNCTWAFINCDYRKIDYDLYLYVKTFTFSPTCDIIVLYCKSKK